MSAEHQNLPGSPEGTRTSEAAHRPRVPRARDRVGDEGPNDSSSPPPKTQRVVPEIAETSSPELGRQGRRTDFANPPVPHPEWGKGAACGRGGSIFPRAFQQSRSTPYPPTFLGGGYHRPPPQACIHVHPLALECGGRTCMLDAPPVLHCTRAPNLPPPGTRTSGAVKFRRPPHISMTK